MEIEARLAALEHLVIAAIVAADARDSRSIAATARIAHALKHFAHRCDPRGTADRLEALLQTLAAASGGQPALGQSRKKMLALHAATAFRARRRSATISSRAE